MSIYTYRGVKCLLLLPDVFLVPVHRSFSINRIRLDGLKEWGMGSEQEMGVSTGPPPVPEYIEEERRSGVSPRMGNVPRSFQNPGLSPTSYPSSLPSPVRERSRVCRRRERSPFITLN